MNVDEYRISKIREYMVGIINTLTANSKYTINANMLSDNPNNYSLDKIPTQTKVEKWIIGVVKHRDIYSFRSRMAYSQDTINNLKNIGFFEELENIIEYNNENGILPNIENIESIECLNCGSMNNANTNTAEFNIQIQITYRTNKPTRRMASL